MRTHFYRKIPKADPAGFALLPFRIRSTAIMILRVADESGRVKLHGLDPGDAIIRLCGASGNERRAVRRTVADLLRLGVFVRSGPEMVATDWARDIFPDVDLPAMPPITLAEGRADAPRVHDGCPTDAQRKPIIRAQCAPVMPPSEDIPSESLGPTPICIEQNRTEREGARESARESPPFRDDLRDVETVTAVVRRWSRQKEVGRPWGGGSAGAHGLIRGALRHLHDVADAEGVDLEQATRITLMGFQSTERCQARGFPLRWWAEDPGSFLPRYRKSLVEKSKAAKMEVARARAEKVDELRPDQVMSQAETSIAFDNLLSSLRGGMKTGAV